MFLSVVIACPLYYHGSFTIQIKHHSTVYALQEYRIVDVLILFAYILFSQMEFYFPKFVIFPVHEGHNFNERLICYY